MILEKLSLFLLLVSEIKKEILNGDNTYPPRTIPKLTTVDLRDFLEGPLEAMLMERWMM